MNEKLGGKMEKMIKECAIVVAAVILLSVLAVLPVMSEEMDENATNVSIINDDVSANTLISALPMSGEWSASAEFGELEFTVNNSGTCISKISYHFSNWTCGSITRSGTVSVYTSKVEGLGPITNGQFTIKTDIGGWWDPSPSYSMTISGKFDEPGTAASGTWEAVSSGVTCSGTWSATPQTTTQLMEGDVTMDKHVTMADAMFIAQYKAGLRTLNASQLQCADTTDDGDVTMADAMHIAQWKADPDGTLGVLYKPLWELGPDDNMLEPVDC